MRLRKTFLCVVFILQSESLAYGKSLETGADNTAAIIKDLGAANIVAENDLVYFFKQRNYGIENFQLFGKAAWLDINESTVLNDFAHKEGRREILVFNSPTELRKKRYQAVPSKVINLGKDDGFKAVVVVNSDALTLSEAEGVELGAENIVLIVCFLPGATYVARINEKNFLIYKYLRQK